MRLDHVRFEFECGAAAWRVRAVVLDERLNRPFRAELRLISETPHPTTNLLGAPAELTMTRGDAVRTFRGEVTVVELAGGENGVVATVRFEPALARLGWTQRSRIFQGMTSLQIVREIVGARAGGPGIGVEVEGEPASPVGAREYCVQHDESDLAFASRLLEDDGMAWFVDDAGTSSVLRAVDHNRAFPPVPDVGELRLIPTNYDEAEEMSIQTLAFTRRPASAGVVERNWTWMSTPATVTEATWPELAPEPRHELQSLRRNASATGPTSVRREYERCVARDVVGSGRSNAIVLGPGLHTTVVVDTGEAVEVLITAVVHEGDCPEVELDADAASSRPNYTNSFECQPLDVPYRPQRTVARPRIHGLHTAVVVGPPDEEIHTDAHGRIKVRMHWDRSSTPDADASCWLRVAQPWSGAGWGSVFIPRVGMEVLVAFIDGDPDRPMCIGSVYNGANHPPYTLPDDRTKSTIRTQSSPGGNGYNELTFEDAAGSEEVYVRAQRNLRTQVLANESRSVGADQTIGIGHDQKLTIDGDQHVTIKGNQKIAVDGGGTEGLPGTEIAVKGTAMVRVTDPGCVIIDAAERIELRVGASVIVIDSETIQLIAGAGTLQRLDETAVILAGRGSMMRLAGTVALNAVGGAMLQMDDQQAILSSALGSSVVLSDAAKLGAGLGAKLELGTDATLDAASIIATAAMGGKLTLDTDAAVEGAQVSCASAGGSMTLSPSGAAIDGTTVDVTAAAMATVVSAMVKIN